MCIKVEDRNSSGRFRMTWDAVLQSNLRVKGLTEILHLAIRLGLRLQCIVPSKMVGWMGGENPLVKLVKYFLFAVVEKDSNPPSTGVYGI